jgi:hypothetical protein
MNLNTSFQNANIDAEKLDNIKRILARHIGHKKLKSSIAIHHIL